LIGKYIITFKKAQLANLRTKFRLEPIKNCKDLPHPDEIHEFSEESADEFTSEEDVPIRKSTNPLSFKERAQEKLKEEIFIGRGCKIQFPFDVDAGDKEAGFAWRSFILYEWKSDKGNEKGLCLEELSVFREDNPDREMEAIVRKWKKQKENFRLFNYNETVSNHFGYLRFDRFREKRLKLRDTMSKLTTLTLQKFSECSSEIGTTFRIDWEDGGLYKRDVEKAVRFYIKEVLGKDSDFGLGSVWSLQHGMPIVKEPQNELECTGMPPPEKREKLTRSSLTNKKKLTSPTTPKKKKLTLPKKPTRKRKALPKK